jgi:hypothetical protein
VFPASRGASSYDAAARTKSGRAGSRSGLLVLRVESARDSTFNATLDSTVDAAHDRAVDATHAHADTHADRSAGGRRLAGARGGGTASLDGDHT